MDFITSNFMFIMLGAIALVLVALVVMLEIQMHNCFLVKAYNRNNRRYNFFFQLDLALIILLMVISTKMNSGWLSVGFLVEAMVAVFWFYWRIYYISGDVDPYQHDPNIRAEHSDGRNHSL